MKSSQIDAVHCSSPEDRGTVFEIYKENPLLAIETKFKNHWTQGSNFLIVFVQAKYALESKNNNHTARYLSRMKLVQSRKG